MQGSAPFSEAPLRARSKIALGWCVILWAARAATLRGLTGPASQLVVHLCLLLARLLLTRHFSPYIVIRDLSPLLPNLSHQIPQQRNLLTSWLVDPVLTPKRGPRACSSDKISSHPATHPNAWGHSGAEQTPLMKWYNFSKLMRRRWPEPTGMNPNGQQAEEISPRFPHKLTEVTLARVWIFLASSSLQLYTWLGLICYLCQLCIFVKFKGLLPWPDLAKSELTCGSLVAISF